MREKRNILISIGLGGILGWILGFLRLPFLEKNDSFFLGFIACLAIVFLSLLLMYVWKKNALVSNLFRENSSAPNSSSKNIFLSILTLSCILIGGFTSSFLFFQQNKFSKIQAQQLHKKTAAQFELEATTRKSNALLLINNLFDKMDAELKNSPNRILSDEMIERIAALNYSFEPYQYFDGEKFSEKKWSPERGQLLLSLAKIKMNSSSFNQIKSKTSFRGADLKNVNLAGADLSEVDLRNADLADADLSETNLSSAKLTKANLQNVNFQNANLTNANLHNSELKWANFDGGILSQANLNGANLSNTKMRNVDSRGADFSWANFNNATLTGANFSKSNFSGTNLSRSNLVKTNLSEANLSDTNLSEVNLNMAILNGAKLTRTVVNDHRWFDKLTEWKISSAKNIQENNTIEEGKSSSFKFRLRKK